MSGAVRSSARASSRRVSFSSSAPTASSRSAIVPGSRSGLASRAASSRAPGPVTVRSMAASRLPCRSPPSERSSSRLARLGASMTRRLAGPVLRGGRRQGRLPSCVSSTYLRSAPTAASSGLEKSAKAARSATPSWALRSRSPARLSKDAAGTGVGAAPAMPIHDLQVLVGEQPVGGDHLARREAHDLAGEVAHRHLADLELAGREVERGQRDHGGCAGTRFRACENGSQIVARFRIEQAVLGQCAGRDEAHDVAAHDRL